MMPGNHALNKHIPYPEFKKLKGLKRAEKHRVSKVKKELVKLFTEIFSEQTQRDS